jgi:hypothetical protein
VALFGISSYPDPGSHVGLILLTALIAAIGLYLIYTMLRPDAF